MAVDDDAERRRRRRVPVRVLVEYGTVGDFLEDYSANASVGGIFIRTEKPLEHGTRFRLRFQLPGHDRVIETDGVVCWVQEPGHAGMNTGMGVRFEALDSPSLRMVERLIRDAE